MLYRDSILGTFSVVAHLLMYMHKQSNNQTLVKKKKEGKLIKGYMMAWYLIHISLTMKSLKLMSFTEVHLHGMQLMQSNVTWTRNILNCIKSNH